MNRRSQISEEQNKKNNRNKLEKSKEVLKPAEIDEDAEWVKKHVEEFGEMPSFFSYK